ncbi:hypothetical protein [Chitinimonas koreensis]|nr:hypothetical protein [Chitinimonas koreensis]
MLMREYGAAARRTAQGLGWEAIVERFEQVALAALARTGGRLPSAAPA